MKIQKKLLALFLFTTVIIFSFSSCKKENIKTENIEKEIEIKRAVKLKNLDEETKLFLEEKNIFVVLAHNFYEPNICENLIKLLDENFGVQTEENDGLIKIMIFPDDFMVSGKIRVSSLYAKLKEENPAGLIILGSPEGICNSVARLEDLYENRKLPYAVIQLFPQDDILGTESTSNFVLDYAKKSDNLEAEETVVQLDFDYSKILINSIDEVISSKGPIPQDSMLFQKVQKISGPENKISHYVDVETGLQSINHFIFQK